MSLITEGQERGYLTQEELAARLEDFELSDEQLRDVHAPSRRGRRRRDRGRSRSRPVPTPDVKLEVVPDEAAAEPAKRPEIDLTVEPSLDSLRLYLRSIGKVELLTAEQEVALAKRIERGDMNAKE